MIDGTDAHLGGVLFVSGVGFTIAAGCLWRSMNRLLAHFHDLHYSPVLLDEERARPAVGDRPLSWWAVKRVGKYAGRINLYLAAGFTLAESAYMAMPALSWMGTVVGDPLYRPFKIAQELALRADFGDINPEVDFKATLSNAEEMRAFATIMHQRRSKPANVVEAELVKYGRKYRSGRIFEGLGLFQFANGNSVDAARTFDTARELYAHPDDVLRVTMHEARALAKGGNKPRALALLGAAIAKNLSSPALESLRALENQLESSPVTGATPTPVK